MLLANPEDRGRSVGAALVYEELASIPVSARRARLAELSQHFPVTYTLRAGHALQSLFPEGLTPGEPAERREGFDERWLYTAFSDDSRVLVAGPLHRTVPHERRPVLLLLVVLCVPIIALGLVAIVDRQVLLVEDASRGLARGELTTRVPESEGAPSDLARSFNVMAERIERLVRSRDELVQAVSHELGSPLSRIRFQLELLELEDGTDRTGRFGALRRDLDGLDQLVSELLTYVQSDEGRFEPTTFDPQQTLEHLAELCELDAPGCSASVHVDVADVTLVYADPLLFQRAVENLLRNAVRYAAAEVRISVTSSETGAVVVVRDDGPGIPESLREKVLQPFVRLEEDRGRTTGGVGLGLAIVSRIVERHGGSLSISDSPSGGAHVAILWPSAAKPAAGTPSASNSGRPPS